MSAKSAAEKQTSHIQSAIVVFTFHFQDATATADLPDHPEFIRKYKSDGTPNCDNDESLTPFFALLKSEDAINGHQTRSLVLTNA